MIPEDFVQRAQIMLGEAADVIRRKYIECFVDTESPYFQKYIEQPLKESHGQYYYGYLWDTLKRTVEVVDKREIQRTELLDLSTYVFWDLHTSDHIRIPNYWKFPLSAVIRLQYSVLLEYQELFPDDIYCFDDSFDWTLIFTHEYDADDNRFYYRIRL